MDGKRGGGRQQGVGQVRGQNGKGDAVVWDQLGKRCFGFMSSEISSERHIHHVVTRLVRDMREARAAGRRVLLVAGPWYTLVGIRTDGQWLAGFFGVHNFGRFLGAMEFEETEVKGVTHFEQSHRKDQFHIIRLQVVENHVIARKNHQRVNEGIRVTIQKNQFAIFIVGAEGL